MPRAIFLDSSPLSCVGKRTTLPPTASDLCRDWIFDCLSAGHEIYISAIVYYEVLRELERLGASAQIGRLKQFCALYPQRFLVLETAHLEVAAQLWARARQSGTPTSAPQALDGDVILAAQALSLGLAPARFVVATSNVAHLGLWVPAQEWTQIVPGA